MKTKPEDKPIVLYGRTRRQFEKAMGNADCKLFEDIARWVVQDEGYRSMAELVARIKNLEQLERKNCVIPPA